MNTAYGFQLGNIKKFFIGSIGMCIIKSDLPFKSNYFFYNYSNFIDGLINASANIEKHAK